MSDPFETVMSPLMILRARVGEVLARHGLSVGSFAVMPGPETEGPHEVQVVVTMDGEQPLASDPEFERVLSEARDADLEARAAETLDELRNRLQSPGGFLDGDREK